MPSKETKKLLILLLILFIAQLITGGYFYYHITKAELKNRLSAKAIRINQDIKIDEGKWDIFLYNNDSSLLGIYPLYIISLDGAVVDRRAPIRGFLDTTDLKRLQEFDEPATVLTITGQERRVYTKEIVDEGELLGIIIVSFYGPQESILPEIDEKLFKNADLINSSIYTRDNEIKVDKLDLRRVDYDVAFSIVDKYNTIIERSDNVNNFRRTPSYIDPSYVKQILESEGDRVITDSKTKEKFLVLIQPFTQDENTLGVIAVGESISFLYSNIRQYIIFQGFIGAILTFIALFLILKIKKEKESTRIISLPKAISFDQKASALMIDGRSISIPYATNQYYFLQALFSNTFKRWETDELLKRFGDEDSSVNWRKVYDTMVGINKKLEQILPVRLVVNKNKTYQLNPELFKSKT